MPFPIETKRHSYAHLMAAAIQKLFPEAKFGVGPVVENGFYYDVELPRQLTPEDFPVIEKRMRDILKQNLPYAYEEWPIEKAIAFFKEKNQTYKVGLLEDLKKHGTTQLSEEERSTVSSQVSKVGIYKTGAFVDLCRGPHVASTADLDPNAFMIEKTAGAYWRGNEKNPMLTRVYGVAFDTKKELDAYKKGIEEAKRRDHRILGKQLGLFVFSNLVGPGLPLYTPKGAFILSKIREFSRSLRLEMGYGEVQTPQINKADLFKTSGHYDKYKDGMFHVKSNYTEEEYFLKPMNCPQHTQIYASELRSYKDLPIRFADFATLYRDEKPGELSGLTRLRAFSQDDGHSFLREDQIKEEFSKILKAINKIMKVYGMNYWIRLSLRDEAKKEKYLGDDATWQKAQKALRETVGTLKIPFKPVEGEAAFYGPKMDLMARDSLGREWQLSTIQLDFNMPSRFGLEYIDRDGSKKTPVMIHSALVGSSERFLGIILEHFAGALPLWIAPEQVWVLPIGNSHKKFAKDIAKKLLDGGLRVIVKDTDETVGKKIRDGELQKIPYLLIVGDKEVKAKSVAVRKRGRGDMGIMKVDKFLKQATIEIETKQRN